MESLQSIRRALHLGPSSPATPVVAADRRPPDRPEAARVRIDIAANDPLLAYLQSAPGPVELAGLELDSPAVGDLRGAGVAMVVPLISQGELIGTLNLGPRLSEQGYSIDDRRLLGSLATQAAPAVRVAELVQERAGEIQARERLEQEMRVATLIQQQFLPHELPQLPDWQVAAYYGPARAVGGDFYDFIELPDGRIGIVVGDVTDKGVPAALIMARTQSVLRGEAPRLIAPSEVLARANEILLPEMPAAMFVTCLYLVLEPTTGHVVYANAGHLPPYVRTADGVIELRATGMPLGLLPGMTYEEKTAVIDARQSVLLYSDGLIEAHGPAGDMFGFPRLRDLMAHERPGSELIDHLLEQLHGFVGRGWDQEDDITLVALQRTGGGEHPLLADAVEEPVSADAPGAVIAGIAERQVLLSLTLPGEPGNERTAMTRVAEAVAPLDLPSARVERLKTAVSEATMNAIEYGSQNDPAIPVEITAWVTADDLVVSIADRGLSGPIPDAEQPDLEAKLAGQQKARGWGLFLIKHMVDAMEVTTEGTTQTVTLTLHLRGADDAEQPL
jgi:serine phosphatase RsbU (regulator of sigma subunit)/anti-sigma regulatory factor (Ser/Thr protein kinase)